MSRWLKTWLLLLTLSVSCFGASYELETKFSEELFKLHYGDALKATGHPWPQNLEDHRLRVVPYEDGYWAIIADQQALHTENRMWSLFVCEDGVWKALPYTVGGVALNSRAVAQNRDRIVLRLHLEKLPTRIVDALLDVRDFMPLKDPTLPG